MQKEKQQAKANRRKLQRQIIKSRQGIFLKAIHPDNELGIKVIEDQLKYHAHCAAGLPFSPKKFGRRWNIKYGIRKIGHKSGSIGMMGRYITHISGTPNKKLPYRKSLAHLIRRNLKIAGRYERCRITKPQY